MTAGSAGAGEAVVAAGVPSAAGAAAEGAADGAATAGAEGSDAADGVSTEGAGAGCAGAVVWAGVSAAGGVCAREASVTATQAEQAIAKKKTPAKPCGRPPKRESRSLIDLCRLQIIRHRADITKTIRRLSSLQWGLEQGQDDQSPYCWAERVNASQTVEKAAPFLEYF